MNNKNFGKGVLFLYELSIEVLIDFIAILLTPGIFLIQIVAFLTETGSAGLEFFKTFSSII